MSSKIHQPTAIDKVIFSSGGAKGFAIIGVMKKMEELNIMGNIKYWCGTSIGSLFALLASLQFTSSELSQLFVNFSYNQYQSIDVVTMLSAFGIDNFKKIKEFILSVLKTRNINGETLTFMEHYQKTGTTLIMDAVCLNTCTNTYFSWETFPNMPIIIALQASMSIPLLFTSVKYGTLTYVDGGITGDLINPSLFTNLDPQSVLCVNLFQRNKVSYKSIDTIKDFMLQLTTCVSDKIITTSKVVEGAHVINIFENIVDPVSILNTSPEISKFLIELGYEKCHNYFETMKNKINVNVNVNVNVNIEESTNANQNSSDVHE